MLVSVFLLFMAQKCGSGKYEYEFIIFIEIVKIGCFGQCFIYVFLFKGDGLVIFNGCCFVELEGEYYWIYLVDIINMVFFCLIEADLYQYEWEYMDNVMDLLMIYFIFEYDGKQKKIKFYYGYLEELGIIVE